MGTYVLHIGVVRDLDRAVTCGLSTSLGGSLLMFSTRLAALVAVLAIAAVALPAVASANTGTVTCDSRGVVFSYRANFNPSRVSTEVVGGATQPFTVPKWTAVEHVWPGIYGPVVVSAS